MDFCYSQENKREVKHKRPHKGFEFESMKLDLICMGKIKITFQIKYSGEVPKKIVLSLLSVVLLLLQVFIDPGREGLLGMGCREQSPSTLVLCWGEEQNKTKKTTKNPTKTKKKLGKLDHKTGVSFLFCTCMRACNALT